MRHSTTLRTLTFNENDEKLFARNDGWLVLSQLMLDPMSVLVELKLSDNSITNEGLENLTNVLITNSKLRKLILGKNREITIDGWVTFFAILRNPNSALSIGGTVIVRHEAHQLHFYDFFSRQIGKQSQVKKAVYSSDLCQRHFCFPSQLSYAILMLHLRNSHFTILKSMTLLGFLL